MLRCTNWQIGKDVWKDCRHNIIPEDLNLKGNFLKIQDVTGNIRKIQVIILWLIQS